MIGTRFADRYDIIGRLGGGRNGDVWRAVDTNQDMEVALKIFAAGTSTILAYPEAQLLTALEGDHVLRVYNADTWTDIPYIATRIASRGSAEDVVEAQASGIRLDHAVSWVRQALIGLGACHDRGLLHRDVKPANIFLEGDDRAMIGDFGLAIRLDPVTGLAPMEGTPVTMAPEMWDVGTGGLAADIYSVGVSLFRLVSGDWPVWATTRAAFKPLVLAGSVTRVRDAAPHVSRRLASRIEKALERDPARRFQSWREMHEELGHPGVVARTWRPIAPHTGHRSCWDEATPVRATRYTVCAFADRSDLVEVETRRDTTARTRVVRHCRAGIRQIDLPKRLRAIFEDL
jgi:eukaryotic-like serine/threonine-protein kinase